MPYADFVPALCHGQSRMFGLAHGFFRSGSHFCPAPFGGLRNFRSGRRRQDVLAGAVELFACRVSERFGCGFHAVQLALEFAELFFEFSFFALDGSKKIHSISLPVKSIAKRRWCTRGIHE
jgi:hypothetical protein